MVRTSVAAAAVLLLLPLGAFAGSQCPSGLRFKPDVVAPITLRFRDTSIRVLFTVVETLTGTPFRVPAGLDYSVTYDMRSMPACRVLEIMGESQSLRYRQDGETIVVIAPPPEPGPAPATPTTQK